MSKKRRNRTKANTNPEPVAKPSTSTNAKPKNRPQGSDSSLISAFPVASQNQYLVLFLVNVIVAFLWVLIVPYFGFINYLIGFIIGFVVITLLHRPYGKRAYYLVYFGLYVLWQLILSNLSIAKLVLHPKPKLDPGIIGIPLTVSSGLEIMILASAITLTPGTISVDLGHNAAGQQILYVHNLTVNDPELFRQSIKDGFERLLLRATRGDAFLATIT